MSVHRVLPCSFGLLHSISQFILKYSPTNEHLGCFQYFLLVSSAAMNTFVSKISLCISANPLVLFWKEYSVRSW